MLEAAGLALRYNYHFDGPYSAIFIPSAIVGNIPTTGYMALNGQYSSFIYNSPSAYSATGVVGLTTYSGIPTINNSWSIQSASVGPYSIILNGNLIQSIGPHALSGDGCQLGPYPLTFATPS